MQAKPFFHSETGKSISSCSWVVFFHVDTGRAAATKSGSPLFSKLSLNAVTAALPLMKSPNPEQLPQTVPLKVHILLAVYADIRRRKCSCLTLHTYMGSTGTTVSKLLSFIYVHDIFIFCAIMRL